MRNWITTTLGIVAAGAVALALLVPATAVGNTQISGVGVFDEDGECTEIPSFFTMRIDGDLVGCWYNHGWVVTVETPSGAYQERGTETFVGCLADGTTCGTFSTTYTFTAKYAPDGSEIRGACQHPIVSATGDFAGITGRVDFKDDVQSGEVFFTGHINLE
jgi:hypothetical protein